LAVVELELEGPAERRSVLLNGDGTDNAKVELAFELEAGVAVVVLFAAEAVRTGDGTEYFKTSGCIAPGRAGVELFAVDAAAQL